LTGSPRFHFSHRFNGTIWNTVAMPENDVLLLEIRDHQQKAVSFSALHYRENKFLWQDFRLEESWWVNLAAASGDVVLFTIYLETQNPDKKGLLAYGLSDQKLRWWNNDFSLTSVERDRVTGFSSRFGAKKIALDLHSGQEVPVMPDAPVAGVQSLVRPVQYAEGTPHYETVKTFLSQKLTLVPVAALEYLEHDSRIMISYYISKEGLANYLLVMRADGDVILHEKLGEQLKGIGLDTFFMLSGCLFFVKNREELVSYFL
jgi:hypothetical protein